MVLIPALITYYVVYYELTQECNVTLPVLEFGFGTEI
jgi:hypothetical protein